MAFSHLTISRTLLPKLQKIKCIFAKRSPSQSKSIPIGLDVDGITFAISPPPPPGKVPIVDSKQHPGEYNIRPASDYLYIFIYLYHVIVPTLLVPTLSVTTLLVPTLSDPTLLVPTLSVPTLLVPTLSVPTLLVPTLSVPTLLVPT